MNKLDITIVEKATNDLSIMHILYVIKVQREVFTSKGITFKEFKDKSGNYIAASFMFEDLSITISRYDYNEENDYMIFTPKEAIQELDAFEIVEYLMELLEIYPNGKIEWINETLHDSYKELLYNKIDATYENNIFEELREHLKSIGLLQIEYH